MKFQIIGYPRRNKVEAWVKKYGHQQPVGSSNACTEAVRHFYPLSISLQAGTQLEDLSESWVKRHGSNHNGQA